MRARNATFQSLMDRCKAAQGRDPWLNRDIEVAIGLGRDCDNSVRQKDGYAMPLHRDDYYVPPDYSRSLDAAFRLLSKIEPSVVMCLSPITLPEQPHIKWGASVTQIEDEDPVQGWMGYGANPALAVCGAFLLSFDRQLRRSASPVEMS